MGYESDAKSLLRTLIEATAHARYITHDPGERNDRGFQCISYAAFEDERLAKKIEANSRLSGLLPDDIKRRIRDNVEVILKEFPEGRAKWINRRFGKDNFADEMVAIGWGPIYDGIYKALSRQVHAQDYLDHVWPDSSKMVHCDGPKAVFADASLGHTLNMFMALLSACNEGLGRLVDPEIQALSRKLEEPTGQSWI